MIYGLRDNRFFALYVNKAIQIRYKHFCLKKWSDNISYDLFVTNLSGNSAIIQPATRNFPSANSHPLLSEHDGNVTTLLRWKNDSATTPALLARAEEMSHHEGQREILWMPTLWDISSAACTCSESTAAPFMWETLGKEEMRIFFGAHPGQIDGLCCNHRLLSVYNVLFALQCPYSTTLKGTWFLPLCCPFMSFSSFVFFPIFSYSIFVFCFSLIFSYPFALSSHTSFCTHTHIIVFMFLLCLDLSSSFI